MIHPDDRARSTEAAISVMNGKSENDFENRYLRQDGSVVPILWTATWSEAHQIMFCVARDMTARKQLESEILQAKKRANLPTRRRGVSRQL
jgi:PAS domain S-box-containing protein